MNKETKDYFSNYQGIPGSGIAPFAELAPGEIDHVPGYPGLLFREAALAENLEYRIPIWEDHSTNPAREDIVQVFIKPADNSDWGQPFITFTASFDPVTPAAFVPVNIVRGRRPPGQWDIKYEVTIISIPNLSEGEETRLIVDLEAPYASSPDPIPAPIPPAGLVYPIDRSDFPASPDDRVWFSIPDYVLFGRAPGDTLHLFYNGSDEPYLPNPPSPNVDWPVTDLRFPLPLDVVENGPDGFINLRYELRDVAGNTSRLSLASRLDVALMPAPSDLKQPLVNRAFPGDNLIDRNDTALDNGMIVRIPEYSDFQRGNDGDYFDLTLVTTVGSITIRDFPLGSNSFPVSIPVGYQTLATLYGANTGLLPLTVSYVVKRRSVSYPAPVSTTIDLDLFVVGPTPTNPPDLVNLDLFPLIVKGVDAAGTEGEDDELLPEHANRPAKVFIELWDEPPTPDAGPFTIYLWYEGELANTVPVATGMANQVIETSIPWGAISRHSNSPPLKSVYYTIGAAGSSNRQFSPVTHVDVQANIKALDAPVVRNLVAVGGPPGVINCATVTPQREDGNIVVFIPPSDLFERFMVVRLESRGFSDNEGTVEVLAAYAFVDSVPLTQAMINLGFELILGPFSTIMKPIQPHVGTRLNGAMRLKYTIQTVEGPLSGEAYHLARAIRTGLNPNYCDESAAPPAP